MYRTAWARTPRRQPRADPAFQSYAGGVTGDIADHRIRVAALGVQGRVGVVLGGPPHAVRLVPEDRPALMLLQECGQPGGVAGRRKAGRGHAVPPAAEAGPA